jgi:hypothetical protein
VQSEPALQSLTNFGAHASSCERPFKHFTHPSEGAVAFVSWQISDAPLHAELQVAPEAHAQFLSSAASYASAPEGFCDAQQSRHVVALFSFEQSVPPPDEDCEAFPVDEPLVEAPPAPLVAPLFPSPDTVFAPHAAQATTEISTAHRRLLSMKYTSGFLSPDRCNARSWDRLRISRGRPERPHRFTSS